MSIDLHDHICDERRSWAEYDARGIYLTRVCNRCVKARLATYRPEILSGYTQADVDEPIEADEWFDEPDYDEGDY